MRVSVLAAAALAGLASPALAANPPPSINAAFAAAYPNAEDTVTWQGKTQRVRFAPAALYELGPHLFALVSRSENASAGYYSVVYLENEPRMRAVTTPLVRAATLDGAPPKITVAPNIGSFYTLAVESGDQETSVDLIQLGQRPEVVATGVRLNVEDGRCRILGSLRPVDRDKAFTVSYRGSWRGEIQYSWDGAAWQPADPNFTLQSKCPAPKG